MRSLIVDDILSRGGDVSTEFYPGSFRAIGLKYRISGVTVSKIWNTFCKTIGNYFHRPTAKG